METCETPIFPIFEAMLQCSVPAFPASRPLLPGSDAARVTTVGSGRQCSMLFEQSTPIGCCSRILLESSLWTSSMEYCYVWNRLDTRSGFSAFRLTRSGQNISDTESLLWPTPRAEFDSGKHRGHADTLHSAVKLWPTPLAQGTESVEGHLRSRALDGHKSITSLSVAAKLWPTPTGRDWKSTSHGNQGNSRPLSEVAGQTGQGTLNPEFVEALMGFSIGHTRLRLNESPIDHIALKR